MTQTPALGLPLLAASQAQKHVTHNEALMQLDALVQLCVASRSVLPAATADDGVRWIVPDGATGDVAGRDRQIAWRVDGALRFLTPATGWRAWIADEARLVVWDGAAWSNVAPAPNPIPLLGVNAVADAANRVSVKANAALFSHDDVTPGSGDMRLTLNKASSARTASLLLQTGYSGRAEIGLTGDDQLRLRVSAAGSAWTDAIVCNPANGETTISTPAINGPAGVSRMVQWRSAGVLRWSFGVTSHPETGSNAGSYMVLNAYSDSGASLGAVLSARRDLTTLLPNLTLSPSAVVFAKEPTPAADNAFTLGSSSKRWSAIYAATGVINTSDRRMKTDLAPCPLGLDFVLSLQPRMFRWTEGGQEVSARLQPDQPAPGRLDATAREGRRSHLGLVAQEVKAALDAAGVDCGLWTLDDPADPSSRQALRYDQLLAPLIGAVQELAARLERLERRAA